MSNGFESRDPVPDVETRHQHPIDPQRVAEARARLPSAVEGGRAHQIELALADYEAMFGHPMVEDCKVNEQTGEVLPVVTIVTDNGGPFSRSGSRPSSPAILRCTGMMDSAPAPV